MLRYFAKGSTLLILGLAVAVGAGASTFDGAGEFQTDEFGFYYIITGGKDPDDGLPGVGGFNGDNGSGGTIRFVWDDPAWGRNPAEQGLWQRDDWFPTNQSFALTMWDGADIVYDNNGIEDNTYGDYYNEAVGGLAGFYRGYSMSNNFDWVYAGLFYLPQDTEITALAGYFDANGGSLDPVPFDPFNPNIDFRMNIWSAYRDGSGYMPTNTGSFTGDVFSSDNVAGTFSVSDTGVIRDFIDDANDDPIFRLTYALDAPLVLPAGYYFFSHDAIVAPVPVPAAAGLAGVGMAVLALGRRFTRKRAR